MNSNTTYTLNNIGTILGHFPAQKQLVRDSDDNANWMTLEARIRSGDYFMTLATEVDKIAQSLEQVKAPETVELERLVTELLWVNRRYELKKR